MIKHEEARESLLRLHWLFYGDTYKPLEINQTRKVIQYISQQEKVEALLDLYRKSTEYRIGHNLDCLSKDERIDWIEVEKQIKNLESELG